MNSVVETALRVFTQYHLHTWDQVLPFVEFSINNSVSEATGYTPFYLNYGYHPDSFIDLLIDRQPTKVHTLWGWLERMENDFQTARKSVEFAQQRERKLVNEHRKDEEYEVGEKFFFV